MKDFKQYMWEEVPVLHRREKVYLLLGTALFVFFFMLFFQPFGVNNYDSKESISGPLAMALGLVGLTTAVLIGFNEFILYPLFIKKTRRIYMVIWMAWSLIWISSGVFILYNYLGEWHDWRFSSYLEFIRNIGILTCIPLAGVLIYIRMRELRTSLNLAYAYGTNDGEFLLTLNAENQKDQFSLPIKYLVYMESDDNYISIHHLKQETLTKTLFRKSLKSVQEEATHPALVRCHRSFIINLMHVQQLHGNRNRLEIHLAQVKNPIPVSRQYIDTIYQLVEK